jgi:hypothetical protein
LNHFTVPVLTIILLGLLVGRKSVMGLSHLLLEDTLERRKDMLDMTIIIRHIPPPALKIIKNYSKFPKTGFRH